MAGAPEGNQNAVKETRLVTNALRRAVVQSPEKLRKACEKVLNDAVKGNLASFTVLADRIDGKPAQSNTFDGHITHQDITQVLLGTLGDDNSDS